MYYHKSYNVLRIAVLKTECQGIQAMHVAMVTVLLAATGKHRRNLRSEPAACS